MRFSPLPDCQIKNLAEIYEEHLPDLGCFVEVGAFDGKTYSNTYFLAQMGWRGIYIEAHPDFAQVCKLNHKDNDVKVISCAVGRQHGFQDLYIIGECSTLVWDQTAINWGGDKERKITVPVHSLNHLLLEYEISPGFELLVVDVEHSELDVLQPFNLQYWKPKMCIIETHEGQSDPKINFLAAPITEYFYNYGYKKIHVDEINTIFLR